MIEDPAKLCLLGSWKVEGANRFLQVLIAEAPSIWYFLASFRAYLTIIAKDTSNMLLPTGPES